MCCCFGWLGKRRRDIRGRQGDRDRGDLLGCGGKCEKGEKGRTIQLEVGGIKPSYWGGPALTVWKTSVEGEGLGGKNSIANPPTPPPESC